MIDLEDSIGILSKGREGNGTEKVMQETSKVWMIF